MSKKRSFAATSGPAAPRPRLADSLKGLFKTVVDDPVETDLSAYQAVVARIRAVDARPFSDAALGEEARRLRASVAAAIPSDAPDAPSAPVPFDSETAVRTFALAAEASRRALGLDPFDVQLVAGLAMARGRVAELPTGEGKTLAAVFPACLHAWSGRGVHVLTFNDYLARRDAGWMGPIYRMLGFTVGMIQEGMAAAARRTAYACDVTYATAKEAGFDFLRDGIAYDPAETVLRPFHAVLVDEADSILIDEARIPLVIAGVEDRASWDARGLAALVRSLRPGVDWRTDAEHRNVFLTDAGIERIEAGGPPGRLFAPENRTVLEGIYCSLHAQALLRRDVDYIVRDGRIEIVDEFTGRVVDRRHWPDGIQAAVEAKEGLARRSEGRVLGSITLKHFLRLYPLRAGMTATARSGAAELREFYGLRTAIVPAHVPSERADAEDAVFLDRRAKRGALVSEIAAARAAGRPVLVGTLSVRESEELAADLRGAGIGGAVLNAKNDEAEAKIVAEAGRPGAVTISTNMAGRGTDIKLGGADEAERDAAVRAGGLYVIGTNRHESLRIDRQLRGRSGRQGDPGGTRFFVSLDDDLFERYGLTAGLRTEFAPGRGDAPVAGGVLRKRIEHAQRVIEGQNFDIRRKLAEYSDLVELQRGIVRTEREEILRGGEFCPREPRSSAAAVREDGQPLPTAVEAFDEADRAGRARFGEARWAEMVRRAALFHIDRAWSDYLAWVQDTRESIHLVKLGGKTPIEEFRSQATEEFLAMREAVDLAVAEGLRGLAASDGAGALALEKLKGPSSTWTYLVSDDAFGFGMDALLQRNIGFMAAAASPLAAPMAFLTILAKIFRRRRDKRRCGGD